MDGSYTYGDTIYVKQTTKRDKRSTNEEGGSIDQYSAFLNMTDDELLKALASAPLSVPSRVTFGVIGGTL